MSFGSWHEALNYLRESESLADNISDWRMLLTVIHCAIKDVKQSMTWWQHVQSIIAPLNSALRHALGLNEEPARMSISNFLPHFQKLWKHALRSANEFEGSGPKNDVDIHAYLPPPQHNWFPPHARAIMIANS